MRKLLYTSLMTLFLASGSASFAASHCDCNQECQEKCAKGENKDCTCKTCDCKKGKGCSHGKCKHDKE